MRTLLQRVLKGRVLIDGEVINEINKGYVILLGISETDTDRQVNLIAEKTANLRIMPDSDGKMNLSILQTGGEILVVSQFTLYADLSAGRRPSFLKSGNPQRAEKLYELFIEKLKKAGIKKVVSGKFGAYMTVEIVNDGPVTILIDSDEFLKWLLIFLFGCRNEDKNRQKNYKNGRHNDNKSDHKFVISWVRGFLKQYSGIQ